MRLFGILMLVLGFLCLLAPLASAEAVVVMVAILMIIGGIARIAAGLKSGTSGRTWALILGVVMTLGGLALVAQPTIGVLSLTLLLGLYFLADGIVEIAGAFTLKPAPGWGAMLFGGIVTLLLGLLVFSQWPLSGAWAIGVLVGVRLLFAGMTMMMTGSVVQGASADH